MNPDLARLEQWAEEEIQKLKAALPDTLRHRLEELAVMLEEEPDSARVAEGVDADTLGLFEGPDLREEAAGALPPRITLFLLNLWDEAGGHPRRFREEVRRTVLHELGHYLGLDESALLDRHLE
jgi:predicted Zn-dependent protease with MMP-like domain